MSQLYPLQVYNYIVILRVLYRCTGSGSADSTSSRLRWRVDGACTPEVALGGTTAGPDGWTEGVSVQGMMVLMGVKRPLNQQRRSGHLLGRSSPHSVKRPLLIHIKKDPRANSSQYRVQHQIVLVQVDHRMCVHGTVLESNLTLEK